MAFTHVPIALPDLQSVTNDDGTRFYFGPDGRKYPSVTTVLSAQSKAGLDAWRKRVGPAEAKRVSRHASVRGTRFHQLMEDYLNNKDVVPNMLDVENFAALKPSLHKISNIRAQEVALYSDFLRMAGRTDCVAEYEGKLSIIDFKTSLRSKRREWIENYFIQSAAYAIMFEERTRIPVPQMVIMIAVDDGPAEVWIEKRNTWAPRLIEARDHYEKVSLPQA